MIAVVDVKIQAENPAMPLWPMRAYVGSPSSIRVRNVPKKIGDWCINKVTFVANYPDNTTQSVECKLIGGVYVGTIEGSTRSGNVSEGYSIIADGVDESGSNVAGYVLGKGSVEILANTSDVTPSDAFYNVHLLSAESATPKAGDMWLSGDTLNIVNTDNQISTIGGGVPSNLSVDMLTANYAFIDFINLFDGSQGHSLYAQLADKADKWTIIHHSEPQEDEQTHIQPFAINWIPVEGEERYSLVFDGVQPGKAINTIVVVDCNISLPAEFQWPIDFMYWGTTTLENGYANVFTFQQINENLMTVKRETY